MTGSEIQAFQERFRTWLGPDPEAGARVVAHRLGYSSKPWPGSRRFVAQVAGLGFSLAPWRDRSRICGGPSKSGRSCTIRRGNEKAPGVAVLR